MDKIKLRAYGQYDADQASLDSGLKCEDASLAQQQFKDECDINTILERFGVTGELPSARAVPQYFDATQITDYHTAMNQVVAAQAAFMELPAKVRARFENSPEQFIAFVEDESNREEAVRLGLVAASEQAVEAVQESPKASE